MLYKFIDENTVEPFSGKVLRTNGRVYANPTETTLRQHNYKPLVLASQLDDKEGFYRLTTYTEDKNNIYGIESYVEIDEEIS